MTSVLLPDQLYDDEQLEWINEYRRELRRIRQNLRVIEELKLRLPASGGVNSGDVGGTCAGNTSKASKSVKCVPAVTRRILSRNAGKLSSLTALLRSSVFSNMNVNERAPRSLLGAKLGYS